MTVVRGWEAWPRGALHLTFGVFDGVHRGHRDLVQRLVSGARGARARAVVATFDTHPQRVLDPAASPLLLTSAAEKIDLLRAAGADAVVLWHFDEAFSRIEADDFVGRLAAAGDVRALLIGPDLAFGHRRAGDVRLLRRLSSRYGYAVSEIAPEEHAGEPISSTRIRAALQAGELAEANIMLGREYAVRGTVVRGAGRGRALGFPTINIETPPDRLLPKDGIYAMRVSIGDEVLPAAANLGVRPTFGDGDRVLEAYLIGRSLDLYGHAVDAHFVARIRDEVAFPSTDALRAQIARDVEAVKAAL
jgi:riboflavin kinase/FMN adenylyltransferase